MRERGGQDDIEPAKESASLLTSAPTTSCLHGLMQISCRERIYENGVQGTGRGSRYKFRNPPSVDTMKSKELNEITCGQRWQHCPAVAAVELGQLSLRKPHHHVYQPCCRKPGLLSSGALSDFFSASSSLGKSPGITVGAEEYLPGGLVFGIWRLKTSIRGLEWQSYSLQTFENAPFRLLPRPEMLWGFSRKANAHCP